MSSLQKFHRRTQSLAPASPFTAIGEGNETVGYWLGTAGDGTSKLIVAPQSTELNTANIGSRNWGSFGTVRGTTSTTNGLANTNTLAAFGAGHHPAPSYIKSLTTGGYNTWYLPANVELQTLYSNKSATPFSLTASVFSESPQSKATYMSSTENNGQYSFLLAMNNGNLYGGYNNKNNLNSKFRGVRRA